MSEQRFIDLEMKIAHQEDLLEKLNQIVYQQQGKLDQLEMILNSLGKRIQEVKDGGPEIGPAGEKPPHY
ncbi:SlyX family protein [Bdellovibrio sp. HCB337]|uniref:SlyX family protein n=1 Tax=Bdellovibrio sp. HCB337 TaxID=3394358 RepID=UPI0039A66869